MQRTNTFEVQPLSEQDRVLLLELLDASTACYNEVNYQRRQTYFQAQSEHEYVLSFDQDFEILGLTILPNADG